MGLDPLAGLKVVIDGHLPMRDTLLVPLLRVVFDAPATRLAQSSHGICDLAASLGGNSITRLARDIELHNPDFREDYAVLHGMSLAVVARDNPRARMLRRAGRKHRSGLGIATM